MPVMFSYFICLYVAFPKPADLSYTWKWKNVLYEVLLTGRISNVCSVPLFSVIVSESTGAAGESVEAVVRVRTTIKYFVNLNFTSVLTYAWIHLNFFWDIKKWIFLECSMYMDQGLANWPTVKSLSSFCNQVLLEHCHVFLFYGCFCTTMAELSSCERQCLPAPRIGGKIFLVLGRGIHWG